MVRLLGDKLEETTLAQWKYGTFHIGVDIIINSIRDNFEKNWTLLPSLSMFSQSYEEVQNCPQVERHNKQFLYDIP